MDWYNSLNKPFLNPPDGIFMPVWTILYVLIAVALILYLADGFSKEKVRGLIYFAIQILLNFIWSSIFFGMKNIGFALVIILLMWLFILLTIKQFVKHSKIAAIMLIPYFVWVSFACYLNISFFILN